MNSKIISQVYSNNFNINAEFNPSKSRILYISNQKGDTSFFVYDLITTKTEEIVTPLDYTSKMTYDWIDNERFVLCCDSGGTENYNLYLYDISTRTLQDLLIDDDIQDIILRGGSSAQGFYYKSNQNGVYNIYYYDLLQDLTQQITQTDIYINNHTFTQDKSLLCYSMNMGDAKLHDYVYLVDLRSKKVEQLFTMDRPSRIYVIDWSQDHSLLLFETDVDETIQPGIFSFTTQKFNIFDFDQDTYPRAFAKNDDYLVLISRLEGSDTLSVYNHKTEEQSSFDLLKGKFRKDRYISKINQFEFLLNFSTISHPYIIYKLDLHTNSFTKIIDVQNPLDKTQVPLMDHIHYSNGQEMVPAMVALPRNFQPGTRYPAIIYVHGGPWSNIGYGYNRDAIIYTANNFIMLFPNYRGSTGYGSQWMNSLRNQVGDADVSDVISGVDYLQDNYLIDTMGITGISYGGYLSLLAVGKHPTIFQAACSISGFTDFKTLMDEVKPAVRKGWIQMFGGETADINEKLLAASPITYASKISIPLLLVHNKNDSRIPHSQVLQFVEILHNNPVMKEKITLLELDNVGHYGSNELSTRVERSTQKLKFFLQHLT